MTDDNNTNAVVAPKTTRKPRTTKTTTKEKPELAKAKPRSRTVKNTAEKLSSKANSTENTSDIDAKSEVASNARRVSKARTASKLKSTKTTKTKEDKLSTNLEVQPADVVSDSKEASAVLPKKTRGRTPRKPKAATITKENLDSVTESPSESKTSSKHHTKKASPKATQHKSDSKTTEEVKSEALVSDDSDLKQSSQNLLSEGDGNESLKEDESLSSKSRRGRRGGRGKRSKKRALKPMEESVETASNTSARSKPLQATSVAEGKPGRARAAVGKKAAVTSSKRRNMFISVVSGEQVEVALTEEGSLHEYYLEMLHQMKTKGNIYKGVVHNVDTNLQAAFINYGAGKNGFLQIDEIHPEYYQNHHEPNKGKKYPPIQQVIKPGQEILVQVLKEPTGSKGAFLTTWLSLAGRFLVLTPGQEQIGISRKVDNEEERTRLREMMNGIEPGAGLGVIVRTVSVGTSKTTLKNDLQYLKRVWREIRKRGVSESAPLLVYQEPKLAERAIRDYLTDEVHEVWVDNAEMAESLREIVSLLFPRKKDLVRVHTDVRQTLWERFAVQRQLEQIYSREVVLPSGGRLVFDQTEALMAVDINSGKISGKANFASMALKTNLEAAEAIARHLRLRDIGGQIVIDFIEMRDKSHIREVEKTLRAAMKNDRARHDLGRISSFGLLEIVRQRTASSALAITMEPCPHCRGTGMRRNLEWQSLQSLREMMRQGRATQSEHFVFEASPELAMYLLNRKRQRISEIEEQLGKNIEVRIRT